MWPGALNAIEGVSANVSLKEGKATVSYDRKISDAQLRQAVEAAGYHVSDISA